MSKKRYIILLVLIIGIGLIAYRLMELNHLFPSKIGVIIVNDGATATTVPEVYKATNSEATVNPDTTVKPEASDSGAITNDIETIAQEDQMFSYEAISQEIKNRINGKSYGDNCDVPYEDLRYVKVLYWGFDEESHVGELIVNQGIADDILEIFKELYDKQYPIEKMVLVDEYDADDNASMEANNSSAFNYRVVDGTDHLSVHSYGLAIDINPLYNPYVREMNGKTIVTPENGVDYTDRSLDCAYYINKGDLCYDAFISRGFTWGGEWENSKDYQHFQKKLEQ